MHQCPSRSTPALALPWTALLTVVVGVACGAGPDNKEGAPAGDRTEEVAPDGRPDGSLDDASGGASAPDGANGQTADVPPCLRSGPFVADGPVPVESGNGQRVEAGSGPAAARVTGLRWAAHEGCERVVIDLADGDGRAGETGAVRARVLRERGVVRVSLRAVDAVASEATDSAFDGALANGAFAIRSPDGAWIDVDVHLAAAAEAAVSLVSTPARVVVDLRPGGGPVPDPAARSPRVVVLQPRPGTVSYPLTIRGYARTFEANVVARLMQEGREVREAFTTATAWADAWGHFTITFREGPTGPVRVAVGEHSARDGTWQGVAVEVEAEGGG